MADGASGAEAAELPAWGAARFVEACRDNDLATVQELSSPEHMAACRSGTVDLNAVDSYGFTGLYWACWQGHMEVVRHLTSPALLAAGLDVNKGSTITGETPLAVAAFLCRVEVVRHLLESPDLAAAGVTVDVNAANRNGHSGWTPLIWVCARRHACPEVVSLLLRQPQLDVGARDNKGRTALQLAEANTIPDGHGAEEVALIRERMRLPMARLYVLMVAMWSRREGRRAAPAAATGAGAGAATTAAAVPPAVPAGTLDVEDEEAVARRGLIADMPPALLMLLCQLSG